MKLTKSAAIFPIAAAVLFFAQDVCAQTQNVLFLNVSEENLDDLFIVAESGEVYLKVDKIVAIPQEEFFKAASKEGQAISTHLPVHRTVTVVVPAPVAPVLPPLPPLPPLMPILPPQLPQLPEGSEHFFEFHQREPEGNS